MKAQHTFQISATQTPHEPECLGLPLGLEGPGQPVAEEEEVEARAPDAANLEASVVAAAVEAAVEATEERHFLAAAPHTLRSRTYRRTDLRSSRNHIARNTDRIDDQNRSNGLVGTPDMPGPFERNENSRGFRVPTRTFEIPIWNANETSNGYDVSCRRFFLPPESTTEIAATHCGVASIVENDRSHSKSKLKEHF